MKNKLFNPFIYIAGGKALFTGVSAMLLAALLGWLGHGHFDGVLDYHKSGEAMPLYISLAEQGIILGCLVIIFYAGARLFSGSAVRLIDIAGTLALARWPMIFVAGTGFFVKGSITRIEDITIGVVVSAIVALVCSVWMIALSYNAFSVSANIKGSKCTLIFIVCLLLAEVAAVLLCRQVLYQL